MGIEVDSSNDWRTDRVRMLAQRQLRPDMQDLSIGIIMARRFIMARVIEASIPGTRASLEIETF